MRETLLLNPWACWNVPFPCHSEESPARILTEPGIGIGKGGRKRPAPGSHFRDSGPWQRNGGQGNGVFPHAHELRGQVSLTDRWLMSENGRRILSVLLAARQADTDKLIRFAAGKFHRRLRIILAISVLMRELDCG